MKNCVGFLLALAALQMVCSTPLQSEEMSSTGDIVEVEFSVPKQDSRFVLAIDSDRTHNINGIISCGRLCCPRGYDCGTKDYCISLTAQKFPRQPQVKCPDGLMK